MSFQGIEAGKAFVEFLIKDDKLDSGLLKVADKLKGVGKTASLAVAPLIATFAAAAAIFASTGGALDDMHRRTGLSVESLSELSYAAQQTGTDMGVVEKATKALQQNGIDPLRFDEIANDISQIPDHTARAQKAMDIFGSKAGVALLPLLEDLPKLREEARRLGLVMSTEDSQAADAFGDALDASKAQVMALAAQIGGAIAGPLTEFLVWSQGVVASVIGFVHEHPLMVRGIALVAAAIAAASGAATTFGIVLTAITAHPIIAALAAISTILVGVATYFGLASDGAGELKDQLDTIQKPTVSPQMHAMQQGNTVQRQLQGASSVGAAISGPVTPAVAQTAARESVNKLETLGAQQLEQLKKIALILQTPQMARGILWGGT